MKKLIWLVVVCAVGVAFLWVAQNRGKRSLYEHFANESYSLKVRFDYPRGWRLRLEHGKIETFTQAVILGPRNAADTYTHTIIVRETRLDASEDLQQMKKKRIDHLYKDAKVLSESATTVDGAPAQELLVSYVIPPLQLAGHKPPAVAIKSKMIFIQKGVSVFEILYSADSGEFNTNEAAFEQLVKSLRFL